MSDENNYVFEPHDSVDVVVVGHAVYDDLCADVARLSAERDRLAAEVAALKAGSWQPVSHIQLRDGLELHADNIAMTIAHGDLALDTHQWPEDGEYAICRRVVAEGGGR